MKGFFRVLSFVLCAVIMSSVAVFVSVGCGSDSDATPDIKVGMISDPHCLANNNWNGNLKTSLNYFKNENVDAIVIAGDIVDKAFASNYKAYTDTVYQVFGDNPPQMVLCMGNHDFWKVHSIESPKDEMYALFQESTEQTPNYAVKVKGFWFIAVAPDSGGLPYKGNIDWLKEKVAEAATDSGDKPIFVVAHDNAANTTLSASSRDLLNALKDYPQVVLMSGHTHYACQDERTIYQKYFTSIDLGSVAYTTIEGQGYLNHPSKQGQINAFGRILTVSNGKMIIKRVCVNTGEQEKQAYEFDLPLTSDKFTETDAREENAVAPEFPSSARISCETLTTVDGAVKITFDSAECDKDMVYAYRVKLTNVDDATDVKTVYSATDFYKGVKNIKSVNEINVTGLTLGATYGIEISARESFCKWSNNPLVAEYTA